MPNRLDVLSTRTGGDDQSPRSGGIGFTPVNLEPSSAPPVRNAPLPLRILATVWFGQVTVFISALACIVVLAIKLCYASQRLLGMLPPLEAELREEAVRGYAVDYAVYQVMNCCRYFVSVKVIGSKPSFKLCGDSYSHCIAKNGSNSPIPGVRIINLPRDQHGSILIPPGCIVLSNHMSNIDGFSIKSVLFPSASKAIIKAALVKVPIVGWLVSLSNEPLVHFTRSRGGWGTTKKDELLNRCTEVLRRQYPLVVFPEGVRRLFGRMAPFRHGMLQYAIDNEFPLIVAAIHGSEQVLPVHAALLNPGNIYVTFSHKLILATKGVDVAALASLIRDEMVDLLQDLPGYDPQAERPITDIDEYKAMEKAARKHRRAKVE